MTTTDHEPTVYERLLVAAAVLAEDPGMTEADGEILIAFTDELVRCRIYEGMTENDANTASMLIALDGSNSVFSIRPLYERIGTIFDAGAEIYGRTHDDMMAVAAAMTHALLIMLDASRATPIESPCRETALESPTTMGVSAFE